MKDHIKGEKEMKFKILDKEIVLEAPVTVYEALRAAEASNNKVLAAKVNGEVCELTAPLSADALLIVNC